MLGLQIRTKGLGRWKDPARLSKSSNTCLMLCAKKVGEYGNSSFRIFLSTDNSGVWPGVRAPIVRCMCTCTCMRGQCVVLRTSGHMPGATAVWEVLGVAPQHTSFSQVHRWITAETKDRRRGGVIPVPEDAGRDSPANILELKRRCTARHDCMALSTKVFINRGIGTMIEGRPARVPACTCVSTGTLCERTVDGAHRMSLCRTHRTLCRCWSFHKGRGTPPLLMAYFSMMSGPMFWSTAASCLKGHPHAGSTDPSVSASCGTSNSRFPHALGAVTPPPPCLHRTSRSYFCVFFLVGWFVTVGEFVIFGSYKKLHALHSLPNRKWRRKSMLFLHDWVDEDDVSSSDERCWVLQSHLLLLSLLHNNPKRSSFPLLHSSVQTTIHSEEKWCLEKFLRNGSLYWCARCLRSRGSVYFGGVRSKRGGGGG